MYLVHRYSSRITIRVVVRSGRVTVRAITVTSLRCMSTRALTLSNTDGRVSFDLG